MNCPCDQFEFPPPSIITAGLAHLPRQTGTFAEFRRALLRAASIRSTANMEGHPLWSLRYLTERDREGLKLSLSAIGEWRGRHPEDFGMMLLKMWAYVCDLTSFYDSVLAHQSYVRTASRREALAKLVNPLGYVPRPAIGALVDLAAFAEGRRAVTLPVGTAFRSGAFKGHPPQVFELDAETKIHPLLNEWKLLPIRRSTFGATAINLQTVLCKLGSVTVKEGDLVLVKVGSTRHVRTVGSVADQQGVDGETYSAVGLSAAVNIPANTPVSSVTLLKPAATTSLWTRTDYAYGGLFPPSSGGSGGPLVVYIATGTWLLLESISRAFRSGQDVIVSRGNSYWTAGITKVSVESIEIEAAKTVEITGDVTATVTVPAIFAQTTQLEVEPAVLNFDFILLAQKDAAEITIHHAFVPAGKVMIEALPEFDRTDPLHVRTPIEQPRDALAPGEFQLEDKNGAGLTRPGMLNFSTGQFTVQDDPWPQTLAAPVKLLGNVIAASRGETVRGEVLGLGDAAVPNQSFTLKKSPLTYLPAPSPDTPSGLTSTLKVYVDGLQWREVPSLYHATSDGEVYIVRENEDHETIVTFGDGERGRRLNTHALVIAEYRHGAEAAMPPVGSIHQLAKPVEGLKSVRSPVAPYGGADAEDAHSLQKYAPRSALLLGRAVSLPDLEAAAASYAGVRAVAAEWRWSGTQQVPAAHIWYLADGDLTQLILQKLRSLTQPDVPIAVEPAVAWTTTLSIQMTIDPRRFEDEVLATARVALMDPETGLLAPERLGIGRPLFRSRIFEFLLNVPGVVSVTGLDFAGSGFSQYGIKPAAGKYFDFSNGLYLNGRAD
jgi:hypothetical protein